jgi:hypothetical protein
VIRRPSSPQLMRDPLGQRTSIIVTMNSGTRSISDRRPLTQAERELARWMLEHGNPEAAGFLPQLEHAEVVSRCPCGCASIDIQVAGLPEPSGGLRILGDYVFGDGAEVAGAFIFEKAGVLAGIEVYGMAGDAPSTLPPPGALRPF